jgi:hypothetical protein
VALALLATLPLALPACGHRREEPEVVQRAPDVKLDARKAATDRRELGSILAMPHGQAWTLLGAHRVKARLHLELFAGTDVPTAPAPREGKRGRGRRAAEPPPPLSELKVTENLTAAAPRKPPAAPAGDGGAATGATTNPGDFALVQESGPENGKEVVSKDGVLYTRQRYGVFTRWHKPEENEDSRWREDAFSGLATYMRLLFRQTEVQVAGEEDFNGRKVLRLKLQRGEARPAPAAATAGGADEAAVDPGRRWRSTVEVISLEGHLLLDVTTAVPLDCELRATYRYRRDGEPFAARLHYQRQVSDIGAALTVEVPSSAEPPPERPHRLEERDLLLGRNTRRGAAAPAARPAEEGPARLDTTRLKAAPAAPAPPAAPRAP